MFRRLPVLGLRGRLVAALILTSAVALGVAAVTLLPPLERNLRTRGAAHPAGHRDRVAAVVRGPGAAPGVRRLAAPRAPRGRARAPHRRARAAVRRAAGTMVIDTHPHQPDEFKDVPAALGKAKPVTGVRTNSSGTGRRQGGDTARRSTTSRYVLALRKPARRRQGRARTWSGARSPPRRWWAWRVALLLGLGIATTLLRRLRRLRYATLMLADRGLDSELATDTSRDEVGDLGRAFTHHAGEAARAGARPPRVRGHRVARAAHAAHLPAGHAGAARGGPAGDPPDLADARRQVSEARVQSDRLAGWPPTCST